MCEVWSRCACCGVRGVRKKWGAHAASVAEDHNAEKRVWWHCMVVVNAHACTNEKREVGRLGCILFVVCIAHENGANRRPMGFNLLLKSPQAS